MINPITTLVNPTTNILVSAIWYTTIIRLIITTFSSCVNFLILYLFICYTYIITTTSYSYCRKCYTRCYTRSARRSAPRIGNGNVSAHGNGNGNTQETSTRHRVRPDRGTGRSRVRATHGARHTTLDRAAIGRSCARRTGKGKTFRIMLKNVRGVGKSKVVFLSSGAGQNRCITPYLYICNNIFSHKYHL
jgi:hypothetical protein